MHVNSEGQFVLGYGWMHPEERYTWGWNLESSSSQSSAWPYQASPVLCCLLCDNTQVSSYQNNTCKVTDRGALEASFLGSPRILQATKSWVGPGNKASVLVCTQVAFLSNKYWLTDLAFCTSTIFLRQGWSLDIQDYPHYSYRPANLAFTRFKSS